MNHLERQRGEEEIAQGLELSRNSSGHVPIARWVEVAEGEYDERTAIVVRVPRDAVEVGVRDVTAAEIEISATPRSLWLQHVSERCLLAKEDQAVGLERYEIFEVFVDADLKVLQFADVEDASRNAALRRHP